MMGGQNNFVGIENKLKRLAKTFSRKISKIENREIVGVWNFK